VLGGWTNWASRRKRSARATLSEARDGALSTPMDVTAVTSHPALPSTPERSIPNS
jgi:hypothetical protein